jgi:manganese transport protein
VRPIPAIILAQALNGLLLPFVAVFLLLLVNDAHVMGREGLNGAVSNVAMGIVVAVAVLLGTLNVSRAVGAAAGQGPPPEGWLLLGAGLVVAALAGPVARALVSRRRAA